MIIQADHFADAKCQDHVDIELLIAHLEQDENAVAAVDVMRTEFHAGRHQNRDNFREKKR